MYFKRFAQLFIIFLVASAILVVIFNTNFAGSKYTTWFLATVAAYIVLVLPLVVLTLAKARKKANNVGAKAQVGELTGILKALPGYIALSVADKTTIMSFTQDTQVENIFYMVADRATAKAKDLANAKTVSFTTWFDNLETGCRLSSNRATAEIVSEKAAKTLVDRQPNILSIHENAVNMAIIKLTVHSAIFEDFKDGLKVLNFD